MTEPDCRYCHRPVFYDPRPGFRHPWNLVYMEYVSTRLCDAREMEYPHDPEVTHACPPEGEFVLPCCRRMPFDVPATDHITLIPEYVNCGKLPQ